MDSAARGPPAMSEEVPARADSSRDQSLRDARTSWVELKIAERQAARARAEAEAMLDDARDHIIQMHPVLHRMRAMLVLMQSSKFWKLRNAWFRVKQFLRVDPAGPVDPWLPEVDEADMWRQRSEYDRWLFAHRPRRDDLRRMREIATFLPARPLISILMPVFDPAEKHLRQAIESVFSQAYPHWELCIADDASRAPYVRSVLEEFASVDERVKVVFRETNGHIGAASNSALALANGEFIALLDHDDVLSPDALFEVALVVARRPDVDVIYSDEDKIDADGAHTDPYFKPDWSPDSLLARNYVSHLGVYRRQLVESVGGFRIGFEGSQDYDLLLRVAEKTDRIAHIPRILYHWRAHSQSSAGARDQKDYALDAGRRALHEALVRRGEPGRVEHHADRPGTYTVRYDIVQRGRVSIIVPTRDHGDDVDTCLRSVFERSTYDNFEVTLLDNGSRDRRSLEIFRAWAEREPERLRLISYDVPFNFSKINNYAVAKTSSDYVLFLNNDTEVITQDWIEAMVEQAQRPSIGAVGVKLLYDDDTVQHGGVIIGLGGVAGHSHKYFAADAPGYFYALQTVNNFSAVTGACMMVRRELFERAGGFDEQLAIAFNDVDLCLRLRDQGYYNVYLPHVALYHHESKSRGIDDTPERMARFLSEQAIMHERWATLTSDDPHYNPNLTRSAENYALGV